MCHWQLSVGNLRSILSFGIINPTNGASMPKSAIVFCDENVTPLTEIAEVFCTMLDELGFTVTLERNFAAFTDFESLKSYDLIIPSVMVEDDNYPFAEGVTKAVEAGTGILGIHGACSCFIKNPNWRFMMGGSFMAHPGLLNVEYTVDVLPNTILKDITSFDVKTEQFYLHVDPAVNILATSTFPGAPGPHTTNGTHIMPVAWTKNWGEGKVFYCSLGHNVAVFSAYPQFESILKQGIMYTVK